MTKKRILKILDEFERDYYRKRGCRNPFRREINDTIK
jgi:hypothetical protein